MKRNSSKQKGILYYASNALEKRLKVERVNDYLDEMLEKALDEKNVLELIKFGRGIYNWPLK